MKRVALTEKEVSIIQIMAGIATAGTGDGDYEPWTDEEWQALESLLTKLRDAK